jgi:hypothetical protein
MIKFQASTHYFLEMYQCWNLINEHHFDFFQKIHHIHLIHEDFKGMHRF